MNKLSRGISACMVVLITLLAVAPLLQEAYYGILDCSYFYAMAREVRLLDPRTYLEIPFLENRARPGTFILFFPAYFVNSATVHYWVQTVMLLTVPCLCIWWVVYRVTGQIWLGVIAIVTCVCQPSFTENYWTIFKAEPWIMAGCFYVTWLLWLQLYSRAAWRARVVAHVVAVLAVAIVYTLKEPGGAFIGVYMSGLLVLSWGSELNWRQCLQRTAVLTVLNSVGFCILVISVLRLKTLYNASGITEYSIKPEALLRGVERIGTYMLSSGSYLVPTLVIVCSAFVLLRVARVGEQERRRLRVSATWTGYFLLMVGGMLSGLVPWQILEGRQYLVGAAAAPIAAVLGLHTGVYARRAAGGRMVRVLLAACVGASVVLLALQSIYSIVTGHASEGMVRYRHDRAHDVMFNYIADVTPTNGTVYFLMDWLFPEPRNNSRMAMSIFYRRPDIHCVYPQSAADFRDAGLVAVSDYALPCNYDRMPVHHEANALFNDRLKPQLSLQWVTSFVYHTRIWYATNTYHGPQYRSVWGVPAFWDLKRGTYTFGWNIYWYAGRETNDGSAAAILPSKPALLVNGSFTEGLRGWGYWNDADERTNQIAVHAGFVRMANPGADMLGIKQHLAQPLVSGNVYRMSARARLAGTPDASRILGLRLGLYQPPYEEVALAWLTQQDTWREEAVIFTNHFGGRPMLYLQMGYGGIASTVEVTGIEVEEIGRMRADGVIEWAPDMLQVRSVREVQAAVRGLASAFVPASNVIVRVSVGERGLAGAQVVVHTSVWDAVRSARHGDTIHIGDGVYHEAVCYAGHPLHAGLKGLRMHGYGSPRVVVAYENVPRMNECAAEFSCMQDLYLSNVTIHAVCKGSGMQRAYNVLCNGCVNVVIERCVFQTDVYGSNNIVKTFVATQGASNIVMRTGVIATADQTGQNSVHHTATHEAAPAIFEEVDFVGVGLESLEVGDVVVRNCRANEVPERGYGRHWGVVRREAGGRHMGALVEKVRGRAVLTSADVDVRENLLRNGDFEGLAGWSYWEGARAATNLVEVRELDAFRNMGFRGCVRIANPGGMMVGVQQTVGLASGAVYRLSAAARSVATNASEVLFGGRVAVFLPPQAERELVWMSEYNRWWQKELVFTNEVTGAAVVYVHLGYGKVATTGEFSSIRLERIER